MYATIGLVRVGSVLDRMKKGSLSPHRKTHRSSISSNKCLVAFEWKNHIKRHEILNFTLTFVKVVSSLIPRAHRYPDNSEQVQTLTLSNNYTT